MSLYWKRVLLLLTILGASVSIGLRTVEHSLGRQAMEQALMALILAAMIGVIVDEAIRHLQPAQPLDNG